MKKLLPIMLLLFLALVAGMASRGNFAAVYRWADGSIGTSETSILPVNNSISPYRLSTASATWIPTADATSVATIYAVIGQAGNAIALYDATMAGCYLAPASELSIALSGATASKPSDVFVYNSGTPLAPTLALSLTAWTSTTARATSLESTTCGFPVKSGAPSYRYLGTVYVNASNQTEVSYGLTPAAGGSYPKCLVWNQYNRVSQAFSILDSTDTWQYTTATLRQKNADAAANNRFDFVLGASGQKINATDYAMVANSSAGVWAVNAIGLNSITAKASGSSICYTKNTAANSYVTVVSSLDAQPSIGFNYIAPLESSAASGTATWVGDNGAPTLTQTKTSIPSWEW
jgi:hypothetical protein